MRIDGNNPIEGKDPNNKVKDITKRQDTEKKDNANKSDDRNDKISVSGKAKEINELKRLINELPEIRTDRIEALKKAIESGNYNIDSQKIAEKLLEEL